MNSVLDMIQIGTVLQWTNFIYTSLWAVAAKHSLMVGARHVFLKTYVPCLNWPKRQQRQVVYQLLRISHVMQPSGTHQQMVPHARILMAFQFSGLRLLCHNRTCTIQLTPAAKFISSPWEEGKMQICIWHFTILTYAQNITLVSLSKVAM